MNQDNTTSDVLEYKDNVPQTPMGLKVLTVLTFIGSILQFLGACWQYFNAQKSYDQIDKVIEQMNADSMPAWLKSMMGDPAHLVETITKSYQNRIPILVMTLVAATLCFMGALQMRKLKKQGFLFYTIGELLPFLVQFLFIGAFSFSGVFFMIGTGIALLFILLYAMHRKSMVY